ncbi:MAG: YjzD family protein [Streptococcaceae bacterium]|nr:YjzD family protein [Streptococcaceae bacterium]
MKYIVLLFWTLILGQVLGYIAESLAEVEPGQHVALLSFISLVMALAVILIDKIGLTENKN